MGVNRRHFLMKPLPTEAVTSQNLDFIARINYITHLLHIYLFLNNMWNCFACF